LQTSRFLRIVVVAKGAASLWITADQRLHLSAAVLAPPCRVRTRKGERSVHAFSADVTTAGRGTRNGFDRFRREWDTQTGEAYPLPRFDVGPSGDFRVKVQAVKADDVVVADVQSRSFSGRTAGAGDGDARVLLHLVDRGAWHFTGPDDRPDAVTVPAGHFIARHNGASTRFDLEPGTTAKVLILPASALGPSIGGPIVGSVASAEVRMLLAYTGIFAEAVRDLTPAGVQSARAALTELVRGAVRREFDDAEPRLVPALVRAARRVVDERLADPELSPASVSRELAVSVRTLHRAFATGEESVAAYIRRRRLEEARLELAAPFDRPTVSEVAARWHFAHSSHFIRAFRSRYGETPARFARSRGRSPRDERGPTARG
jgi:AraC-like DNA-binding protein